MRKEHWVKHASVLVEHTVQGMRGGAQSETERTLGMEVFLEESLFWVREIFFKKA